MGANSVSLILLCALLLVPQPALAFHTPRLLVPRAALSPPGGVDRLLCAWDLSSGIQLAARCGARDGAACVELPAAWALPVRSAAYAGMIQASRKTGPTLNRTPAFVTRCFWTSFFKGFS